MKKLIFLIPIILGAVFLLPITANASGGLDERLDKIERQIKKIRKQLRNQPKVPVVIDANGKQIGAFLAVGANDYDYLAITNGKDLAWLEFTNNFNGFSPYIFSPLHLRVYFDGPNCTGTAYTEPYPETQRRASRFQGTNYVKQSAENAILVQGLVVQSTIGSGNAGNDYSAICVNNSVGAPGDYWIADTSFPALVFTPPLRIELR